jgi:hypothetical protein
MQFDTNFHTNSTDDEIYILPSIYTLVKIYILTCLHVCV